MQRTVQSWSIAGIAFLGGVGGGVVFPILPVVGTRLGMSGLMIGLILSANRITRLGFNPITGSLLDRFGARWPVAVGLVIEALGTLAFSWALFSDRPGLWFLFGRVIWGMGSSLLLVGTLAAIMAIAPADTRASMTARVRTAISLGLPSGMVIGGLIADRASTNAAFIAASGLSLLGALGALWVLPDRAGEPKASAGSSTRSSAVGAMRGDRGRAWRTLLAVSTLRVIWGANALLFFAVSGVMLSTLSLMTEQRHLSVSGMGAAGSAGLLMAVSTLARAATSLAVGRLLDRSASRTRLLLPAMGLVALGFVGLGQAHGLPLAIASLVVIGVGAGGLTIPLLTLLGDCSPPGMHGRALSIYQWSSDVGGSLGPAVGLELVHLTGYGTTYTIVGLAVLGMAVPLRWLAVREAGGRA